MILLLEDDPDRLRRFACVIELLPVAASWRCWRNVPDMMREVTPYLEVATLISLDHDLEPEVGRSDPGDGYQFVQWLVRQKPVRPVIIHSSNSVRAQWMVGALDLEGWPSWRVAPIGDDWIEADWRRIVLQVLGS